MKIGAEIGKFEYPGLVLIYATNRVPWTIHRQLFETDEHFRTRVDSAERMYEEERKQQVAIYGELEPCHAGN